MEVTVQTLEQFEIDTSNLRSIGGQREFLISKKEEKADKKQVFERKILETSDEEQTTASVVNGRTEFYES